MTINLLSFVAAFGLVMAVLVPVSLYFAWAASILWGWFLVPLGLPALGVMQLWGIALMLSMLRPRLSLQKTDPDWDSAIMATLFGPLLTLGVGYAIKFWWM